MTPWDLSDTSPAAREQFIAAIAGGLRRDGFSDAVTHAVAGVLASTFAFQEDWLGVARGALLGDAEALTAITYLQRLQHDQRHCYDRPSPAATRVVQWPNNQNTKLTQPEHYFDIFDDLPYRTRQPLIDKATPIGSLGSCFALRIAHELQLAGYNYVIEEDDLPPGFDLAQLRTTNYRMAPARVGTLFNTPSMRQVVERGFGEWTPQPRYVKQGDRWIDPFRALHAGYDDTQSYLADHQRHTELLGRALKKCEIMILTLGLTEAWYFADTGEYTSLSPWKIDSALLRHKNLTVADNVAGLERLLEVYQRHQPGIKLIVSVSPVPLNKTFEPGMHIVEANTLSKSVLCVAAHEFAKNHPRDVFYFPSFESVMFCTRNAWDDDQRHVSAAAVAKVMTLFGTMFMRDRQGFAGAAVPEPAEQRDSIKQRIKSRLIRSIARL